MTLLAVFFYKLATIARLGEVCGLLKECGITMASQWNDDTFDLLFAATSKGTTSLWWPVCHVLAPFGFILK